MTDITQCPECNTRFKVSEAQLEAHGGMVRCGRCRIVFDARKYLQDDEPSPQLSLPIDPEDQLEELGSDAAAAVAENDIDVIVEQPSSSEQTETAVVSTSHEPATPPIKENQSADAGDESVNDDAQTDTINEPDADASSNEIEHFLTPIHDIPELEEELPTLAQQVRFVDDRTDLLLNEIPRKHSWTSIFAALLLVLTLIAQALYFYRIELATQLPGLKPMLAQYCAQLNCTVELPRQTDLMSIESSELESDRVQSNVITLHALLHNRATFTQAYPSFELTLTNLQDQPVARRIFRPADYLKSGNELSRGLAANQELDIALRLDTTDLKPAGYRLLLFYPK